MFRQKDKKQSPQMLDAAHGKAVSAGIAVQRVHVRRIEIQVAGIGTARLRRRRPVITVRADIRQGSRRVGAVTRCSQKQSLG